jgi:glycosyltransferase involved in cell wall biosynthesis
VTQPIDGGVGVCARQLINAAVEDGHDVVVASPDTTDGAFAAAVLEAGARHVTLLDHHRRPRLSDASALLTLRKLMRDRDVVHLHSSKAGALGRLAAASLGKQRPRVVFTPHAWSWLVGGRAAFAYRGIERLLARSCDVIVAVSETEADEGRQVLGGASERITVIENGVDLERFSPIGPRARRDESVPLILCVGRLTQQKGQDIALRAVAAMRNVDARLRFVGPGNPADLDSLAHELGIADRVEWTGAVDDTAPEFRAADVVAAPSRWEGMSLVFLEAMACGVPIVAGAVQGAEAVGDGGIVVPVEAPVAVAKALDLLLDDPERRREYGEKARLSAAGHDVRQTTARNLEVWQRLAAGGRFDSTPPTGAGSGS